MKEDRYETRDLAGETRCRAELLKWRERLINILEPRNVGLARNGQLVCQKDLPPIVSSKYRERLARMERKME